MDWLLETKAKRKELERKKDGEHKKRVEREKIEQRKNGRTFLGDLRAGFN